MDKEKKDNKSGQRPKGSIQDIAKAKRVLGIVKNGWKLYNK